MKSPMLPIILVTILLFAALTFSFIQLKEEYDQKFPKKEKTLDSNNSLSENIRQGNVFMKLAWLLAMFLIPLYFISKVTAGKK